MAFTKVAGQWWHGFDAQIFSMLERAIRAERRMGAIRSGHTLQEQLSKQN